jgi:hypothetical protein
MREKIEEGIGEAVSILLQPFSSQTTYIYIATSNTKTKIPI